MSSNCPTPLEAQLDSLRRLERGWHDESSPGYDAGSLAWLSKVLADLLDTFRLPRPYLYPTPEGLARAEWSVPGWEIVTTFDLEARTAEAAAIHLDSDEQHDAFVSLRDPTGTSKLGGFLCRHFSGHESQRRPSPLRCRSRRSMR